LSPNDFQAKYGKAMDLTGVEAQDFKYADLTYKMQTEAQDLLNFRFEIGHRLHSDDQRCYQGVYMQPKIP
jgi:hypothetical protein